MFSCPLKSLLKVQKTSTKNMLFKVRSNFKGIFPEIFKLELVQYALTQNSLRRFILSSLIALPNGELIVYIQFIYNNGLEISKNQIILKEHLVPLIMI